MKVSEEKDLNTPMICTATFVTPGSYCFSNPKFPPDPAYTAREFFRDFERGFFYKAVEHLCWLFGQRWHELAVESRIEVMANLKRAYELGIEIELEKPDDPD